jgi:hypothetical protein
LTFCRAKASILERIPAFPTYQSLENAVLRISGARKPRGQTKPELPPSGLQASPAADPFLDDGWSARAGSRHPTYLLFAKKVADAIFENDNQFKIGKLTGRPKTTPEIWAAVLAA